MVQCHAFSRPISKMFLWKNKSKIEVDVKNELGALIRNFLLNELLEEANL